MPTDQDDKLTSHLNRVDDCGKFAVIIQQTTPVGKCYVRYIARCSSRFCYDCSSSQAGKWKRRIIGSFTRSKSVMITLTFDSRAPDPVQDPKYYSLAWDNFLKRMRRRYPKMKFARIVELHKSGRPHFHILVDRYVPQRYVSWAFSECGGGKVADCRYVDPGRSAQYIVKYLTKSFNPADESAKFFFLTRMRSVSTSRGLYFELKHLPVTELYCHEPTAVAAQDLKDIAHNHGLLMNKILVDDGRSPPFVWVPDPTRIDRRIDPAMVFPLSYEHLQLLALDLDNVPAEEDCFVLLPDGETVETLRAQQQSLLLDLPQPVHGSNDFCPQPLTPIFGQQPLLPAAGESAASSTATVRQTRLSFDPLP